MKLDADLTFYSRSGFLEKDIPIVETMKAQVEELRGNLSVARRNNDMVAEKEIRQQLLAYQHCSEH
jgi:hypothetical protein